MTNTDSSNQNSAKQSLARIDPKMLGTLVCPKSRGPLIHDKQANELISKKAKLAYPIRDGVPILLESAARPVSKFK